MIVLFGLYLNLCVWGCEKFICAYMAMMHVVCWSIFYMIPWVLCMCL